jgi:hypothetical protein
MLNYDRLTSDNDLELQVLRHLKKLHNGKKTRKIANDIFNYIVHLRPESSLDCWGQATYWDIRNYNKNYDLDAVLRHKERRQNGR